MYMAAKRPLVLLAVCGVLLASLGNGGAQSSTEWWQDDEGLSGTGGASVVLRQATATWCEVCKVSDPIIIDFAESKGTNIVRIAIHPQDGIDPLGTSMSTRQAWLLADRAPSELEYPTSWFDNTDGLSGQLSSEQLQREMLRAQGSRQTESLSMSIVRISEPEFPESYYLDFEVSGFSSEGTLSVFITEDSVDIGDLANNMNGIRIHQDVMRAGFIVNATAEEIDWEDRLIFQEPNVGVGERSWGFDFETEVSHLGLELWLNPEWNVENLNFVIVHEADDGTVLSAMALPGERSTATGVVGTTALVIGLLVLGGLLLAVPATSWAKISESRPADANTDLQNADSEE
jgi:thiol-disulfide isomerase/thioredoxin